MEPTSTTRDDFKEPPPPSETYIEEGGEDALLHRRHLRVAAEEVGEDTDGGGCLKICKQYMHINYIPLALYFIACYRRQTREQT